MIFNVRMFQVHIHLAAQVVHLQKNSLRRTSSGLFDGIDGHVSNDSIVQSDQGEDNFNEMSRKEV